MPIATKHNATTTARVTDDAPANTTIGSAPTNTPATGSSVQSPAHTPSAAGPGTPAARAIPDLIEAAGEQPRPVEDEEDREDQPRYERDAARRGRFERFLGRSA